MLHVHSFSGCASTVCSTGSGPILKCCIYMYIHILVFMYMYMHINVHVVLVFHVHVHVHACVYSVASCTMSSPSGAQCLPVYVQ